MIESLRSVWTMALRLNSWLGKKKFEMKQTEIERPNDRASRSNEMEKKENKKSDVE